MVIVKYSTILICLYKSLATIPLSAPRLLAGDAGDHPAHSVAFLDIVTGGAVITLLHPLDLAPWTLK